MQKLEKNYYSLLCFSGAGSKLLQAQLGNADNVFTIPVYPLMYFPLFFREWSSENKGKSPKNILKLIIKHHKSILNSRFIRGFNGLNNLGQDQSGYIKISENKFKVAFLKFLNDQEVSQKNVIMAIHHAYQFAINNKSQGILYHPHSIEIYNKHLIQDFKKSKILAITRNPIYNFWRRAYADEKIDEERFDKSDFEYLRNYRYINRLRDLCINFKNLNKKFTKNCKFYTFENLKNNNYKTLKKICSFLKIKFNYKKIRNPKFQNKTWWGSQIYKGYNSKKSFVKDSFNNPNDLNLFSNHEIFVLEMTLNSFMKKFKYKTRLNPYNKLSNHLKFFIYLLLPTKYGSKLFLKRFNYKNFLSYFIALYQESLKKKKLKITILTGCIDTNIVIVSPI